MSLGDLEAEADVIMCCASCGIAEIDDIKLNKCVDCDLVQYCSDKCQKEHQPKHEAMCKERVAEIRDEILFRQPECTNDGDCPICFLPLPIDQNKSMLTSCCSKMICDGCVYASQRREMEERLESTCSFCRHPLPQSQEEAEMNNTKRVGKNDPVAIREIGSRRKHDGDYESAFEYYTKAAELGDSDAHYQLSMLYREGKGVEKDEEKEKYHLEEAAIAGDPDARYALGIYEGRNGTCARALKHFIIAANLGYDNSIQALKECFKAGLLSKEEFATALRAHQAAVDATKSPQREEAAKIKKYSEERKQSHKSEYR